LANTIFRVKLEEKPIVQNQTVQGTSKKVGRNDPCPCGAKHPDGRSIKYKYCHGRS